VEKDKITAVMGVELEVAAVVTVEELEELLLLAMKVE
jgi:hypothetical protein